MNMEQSSLEEIPSEGRLMTYEEYENAEQSFPYHFEVEKNGQRISYFGAEHFFDPHHEQTAQIKKAWQDFLSKADREQVVVFVEGGTMDINEDEESTIKHHGEAGLATFLAQAASVSTESPEPPLAYEVKELLKQFSREEILYYYFARAVNQWEKTDKKEEVLLYVRNMVSDEAEALGFQTDILAVLSETHKRLFGTTFNLNDPQHFEKASDPTNIYSVSNQVARATSILRDRYIVKEIEKKWKEGKSLFIVYGATHAIMQEPAIRELTQ